MKVVLFCGGQGMRMREYSQTLPKPLVPIGTRPVLWHLMKYYAHFGHRDFILCLGYKGETFKEYFLNYKEWVSNDFVLENGANKMEMMNKDIDDWRITFVDTGVTASVGERLRAIRHHVKDEEMFLANYSDGLSDFHLPDAIELAKQSGKAATFMAAHPNQSFHVVRWGENDRVMGLEEMGSTNMWINAGFFVLRPKVFEYMKPGEELVYAPFERMAADDQLQAYRYTGFWRGMDTFKDRQELDAMLEEGRACWQVWKQEDAATRQEECHLPKRRRTDKTNRGDDNFFHLPDTNGITGVSAAGSSETGDLVMGRL